MHEAEHKAPLWCLRRTVDMSLCVRHIVIYILQPNLPLCSSSPFHTPCVLYTKPMPQTSNTLWHEFQSIWDFILDTSSLWHEFQSIWDFICTCSFQTQTPFAIVSLFLHSIGHCILHTSSLSHGFSTSFVRVHSRRNLSLALSRCCERKLLLTCHLTLHCGYKPPFTFYLKMAKVVCTWNTTSALVILWASEVTMFL